MSWALAPDPQAGGVRYRLQVPALELPGYMALQRVAGAKVRGAGSGWRRLLTGLLLCVLIGGPLGYAAAHWNLRARLWISSDLHEAKGWILMGSEVFFLGVALVMLTALALVFLQVMAMRRMLRAYHRASGEVLGAHELLLGEKGLVWRNRTRVVFVPWSQMDAIVTTPGTVFLMTEGPSAFWLPESLLAGLRERQGVMDYLQRHIREKP
ncbi:hypothetical protein [Roseococcus pinisoli]|uniref:YcxB family protein n=1 Tax=Roseococcus pinisoli TaxID=2835040 RepID=A0ABS5QGJ5_9PROT|nr:hypothetical protein [Roseococcus pinisoli]MBS7812075.1 YcxB family protein [Roseococcus pinisoli]